MLEPIIEHQKELKELFKKMEFLRDNFDFGNSKAFLDELGDVAIKMREELEFHFNLQKYAITNEKAKKFVMENMLVREMLFRMLDFIIAKSKEESIDAFSKFDDFEEIFKAYLKKEKGLFIQQLKSVLSDSEIEEVQKRLRELI
jgi:hypothetical protein